MYALRLGVIANTRFPRKASVRTSHTHPQLNKASRSRRSHFISPVASVFKGTVRRAIIMPNLVPPVTTTEEVRRSRGLSRFASSLFRRFFPAFFLLLFFVSTHRKDGNSGLCKAEEQRAIAFIVVGDCRGFIRR